jgi:hypothetical protein
MSAGIRWFVCCGGRSGRALAGQIGFEFLTLLGIPQLRSERGYPRACRL